MRWAGLHDDTWEPYANLKPAFKRAARLWARAVLGGPAGNSTTFGARQGGRFARARFRRLVRGLDRGGGGTSYVQRAATSVFPAELADHAATHWTRVIADPPAEMELRGEAWRQEPAARGRGVKRRR